jgi:putative MFS transporter
MDTRSPAASSDDLLAMFDEAPLNARYWGTVALTSVASALDFFDFYIVGFLVAVLAPQWHLTYGESSVMLLSAGVGAIIGALAWGALSDAWGRKLMFISGTLLCAVAAAAISIVPDGAWLLFAVLRFFVGFGLAATQAPLVALLVEYTPTRYRTVITSLTVVFATVGTLLASLTGATLLAALGWRGVALLGIVPAAVGILALFVVPESVRWLVAKGRFADAQALTAKLLDRPLASVPLPTAKPVAAPRASLGDLYAEPSKFWLTVILWTGAATANYGVYLWGPTVVALLLHIPVKDAAHYFVYIALCGILGKTIFSFLPQWLGRRLCAQLHGFGIAITLALAGYVYPMFLDGFPVFVLLLMAAALFFDGGFANLAPYTVEFYGVRLGARASGLGQAANGAGKILGPLCLALIAGTNNFVTPQATEDAVFPAFLFLAAWGLAMGIAASFLATETHGRPLSQGEEVEVGRVGTS